MLNFVLEKDFVTQVGSQIDGFSWTGDRVAACRCPYCGDSKKKKNKRRGYFFIGKDERGYDSGFRFKCHNCGMSVSLYDFLKEHDESLYKKMKFEFIKVKKFEEEIQRVRKPSVPKSVPKTVSYKPDLMVQYPTIFELDKNHRARVYMEQERMMPKESLMRIYYVENFPELANQIDTSKELNGENARIIFPLYTRDKSLFGVSARCIGKESDLRYITIKRPDSKHIKVYGLDRYNPDIQGFCVEGALDSEFLPNCISLTGAGKLKKTAMPFNAENMIMVYDNEPLNNDVVRYMKQSLHNGMTVCVWGRDYPYKDINLGIQNGWTREMIVDHILKNSYQGIMGLAKIADW